MKRTGKFIISSLLLVGMSFSLFGCNEQNQVPLENPISTRVLFDFEEETALERMEFYNQTGERKLTDERVLQGERSLEMTINATNVNTQLPAFSFSTVLEGISEMTAVDNIGVDIYNPETSDLFVGMKLLDGVNKTLYNEVKYVSPSTLGNLRFVIKDFSAESKVASIQFYVYKNGMEKTGIKCYIDNITVTETRQSYIKTLSYGEIVSFTEYADIDFVNVESKNSIVPVVAKAYERNALCLNFLGYFDKSITDFTVEEQKVTLSVSEELLEKIDFSGIDTVYADFYNEGYTERKVTIWYENGAKRTQKTFTITPGKWQTIKISTDNQNVEKFGFEFNSADIVESSKMLIRSIRYAL